MADRKVDIGIIQRGSSYRFTVCAGYDVTGKQIKKTSTWKAPEGTTQKKADKLAKEAYLEFKNRCKGLSAFNENMRFKDLVDDYLRLYAPNKLKPITAYNYEHLINFHFIGTLGNMKLKDITTGVLTDFFNTHTAIDKQGNETTLPHSTARKLYTIMQSIFSYAEQQHYIKETPARNVILPSKSAKEDDKRKFMTTEECNRFLEKLETSKDADFKAIIKVLLYTGMRSGECLGLQWEDIDFNNRIINIRHTLSDVGGKHFLTTPKTKNSKRYIAMSEPVERIFKEQRKRQMELKLTLKNFEHPEMCFTSNIGNYKDRSCLNTSFRRFFKGSEFDFLTLHCLRHCNATLLLNSGVDLKVVSEHLGHSDISVTADIYADVLAETRRKTADVIAFKLAQ